MKCKCGRAGSSSGPRHLGKSGAMLNRSLGLKRASVKLDLRILTRSPAHALRTIPTSQARVREISRRQAVPQRGNAGPTASSLASIRWFHSTRCCRRHTHPSITQHLAGPAAAGTPGPMSTSNRVTSSYGSSCVYGLGHGPWCRTSVA